MRAAIDALARGLGSHFAGDPVKLARAERFQVVRRETGRLFASFIVPVNDAAPRLLLHSGPALHYDRVRHAIALAVAHYLLGHRQLAAYCYDRTLEPVGIPEDEAAEAAVFAAAFLGEARSAA